MTLYGVYKDEYFEVFRGTDGVFRVNQVKYHKKTSGQGVLRFCTTKNPSISNKRYLFAEMANDPNGTSILTKSILLNDKLTRRAKEESEAMRVIWSDKTERFEFEEECHENEQLMMDVFNYMLNLTGAKRKVGCYIVTAVYGSYDCPEVWTLRRFRDDSLARSVFGRAFIRVYYAVSPTLVKHFGELGWFKRMWRSILDRLVRHFQDKGVESTPYEDRDW